MAQHTNFANAKATSDELVAAIQEETENYCEYGMMGPDLFVAIAPMTEQLDPKIVSETIEYLVDNGLSPEAAQQVIKNLPNVASGLITCLITGQQP